MNAIDVRGIVKKFGDFTAVNGISFAVEAGEIFGLLGPNGAGKSTLIRMMVTLLTPTAGTALVNGFDIVKESDGVRQSIGVIPQAMTSDLELSVEENLIIFAPLVLILNDLDYSTQWTVYACAVYFWARVAHLIVYTLGLPVFRTLAFTVGFLAQAVLALAIFKIL